MDDTEYQQQMQQLNQLSHENKWHKEHFAKLETWHKEEFAKLDALRLQHAKLEAKSDFIESELREHKNFVSRSIGEIQEKIEKLNNRFDVVAKEVTTIATKVAMGAVVIGLLANILLKHLGFV